MGSSINFIALGKDDVFFQYTSQLKKNSFASFSSAQ